MDWPQQWEISGLGHQDNFLFAIGWQNYSAPKCQLNIIVDHFIFNVHCTMSTCGDGPDWRISCCMCSKGSRGFLRYCRCVWPVHAGPCTLFHTSCTHSPAQTPHALCAHARSAPRDQWTEHHKPYIAGPCQRYNAINYNPTCIIVISHYLLRMIYQNHKGCSSLFNLNTLAQLRMLRWSVHSF